MNSVIILTWNEFEDAKIISENGKPRLFKNVKDAHVWSDDNDSEFGDYFQVIDLL